jgi:hypothetical protein
VDTGDNHTNASPQWETADTKKVLKALGAVAAALVVIAIAVTGDSGGGVPLGVAPAGSTANVFGTTYERSDGEQGGAPNALDANGSIITIPVPQIVAVDRPFPVVMPYPMASGSRTAEPAPVLRSANGPAAPEISQIAQQSEYPSAGEIVRFRWWGGDADGHLRLVKVDYGDGKEDRLLLAARCVADPTDPVQERAPFQHKWDSPGTYQLTLSVSSGGSCGNGPTQVVSQTIEVRVGLVGVGSGATGNV